MFPQTFDQPFDLVITSTECSPIVYFQSNSQNEIRLSFKSQVTVSIEKLLDTVPDSLDSVSLKDSGSEKVNNCVFRSFGNGSNSYHESCSSFNNLECSFSVTSNVSVWPSDQQNNNSANNKFNDKMPSGSEITHISRSVKYLQENRSDFTHACGAKFVIGGSCCSGKNSEKHSCFVGCENHESTIASTQGGCELVTGLVEKDSLKDPFTSTTTDYEIEDSESEIEFDWPVDSTSSNPFTTSVDQSVKRPENATKKTLSSIYDRLNLKEDDHLLKAHTKVHVLRLNESIHNSNESASNLDQFYSELSENLFKNKIDFVHRYIPRLEQNNEFEHNDDESDDDPLNRASDLQKNEKDSEDISKTHDSQHPDASCFEQDSCPTNAINHGLKSIPLTPHQSVMLISDPLINSASRDKNLRKSDKSEERKVQSFKLKKRKRAYDKMTNRSDFKRRRLNFNFKLFMDKITQLNAKLGQMQKSENKNKSGTYQMPMNSKASLPSPKEDIINKPSRSAEGDINMQIESEPVTTGVDFTGLPVESPNTASKAANFESLLPSGGLSNDSTEVSRLALMGSNQTEISPLDVKEAEDEISTVIEEKKLNHEEDSKDSTSRSAAVVKVSKNKETTELDSGTTSIEREKVPTLAELAKEIIKRISGEKSIITTAESIEDESINSLKALTDISTADDGSAALVTKNVEKLLPSAELSCNDSAETSRHAEREDCNILIEDAPIDKEVAFNDNTPDENETAASVSKEVNLINTETSTSQNETIGPNEMPEIVEIIEVDDSARSREIELVHTQMELEDTIETINEERERMERLTNQEKKFNRLRSKVGKYQEKPILDFDESGNVRVEVSSRFLNELKDQQDEGIKFMYNSTIENVDKLKEGDEGSGCILAHYKGLNKTLQVIAFVHTLLSNPHFHDHIKTILIAVPDDVLVYWKQQFNKWIKPKRFKTLQIFEIDNSSPIKYRCRRYKIWHKRGGILIIGQTLLGSLSEQGNMSTFGDFRQELIKHLVDPGPDLIIIDEGQGLKSNNQLHEIVASMRTRRKILLTGTRLETNLVEYYTMIDVIKPRLLGSIEFFADQFKIPIEKGQKANSTSEDLKLMKEREIVLHQLLAGSLQMYNFVTLGAFLPPKFEFALFVRPTRYLAKVYNYFLAKFHKEKCLSIHSGYFRLCVNHPGFYHKVKESLRFWGDELSADFYPIEPNDTSFEKEWYKDFILFNEWDDFDYSCKFVMFFKILKKCISNGEKLVVASQSIETLDLIEEHLNTEYCLDSFEWKNQFRWVHGANYFRIDSDVHIEDRLKQIEMFNDPENKEARLFLLSTKAGGIAIDLHGANRLIIFDVSWNPSDDIQAICRVYRMGQTKPVYVYRFVTKDTMEEVIFLRQIKKLLMSIRGLDQQQVENITTPELNEFYDIHPKYEYQTTDITKPQSDSLLFEILSTNNNQVVKCFEFDSLMEKIQRVDR